MNYSLRNRKPNSISFISISPLVATLSLIGCGGGGGGSSSDSQHVSPTRGGTVQSSVHLAWQSPTRNVDGSCADDIAAYRVNYGTTPGGYFTNGEILYLSHGNVLCEQVGYDSQCGLPEFSCTYLVSDLQPGTWYFSVQAIDSNGYQSTYSEWVSKDIY